MSRGSSNLPNPDEVKLLPAALPAIAAAPSETPAQLVSATNPLRQLADRKQEELDIIAEDLGLKLRRYKTRQALVSAIHERRQQIAGVNRDAMVDVLRWANRPPPPGTSKETLAHEIVSLKTMRFEGLTQRGLIALATLRGLEVKGDEKIPLLIRRLRRQETFFFQNEPQTSHDPGRGRLQFHRLRALCRTPPRRTR